MTMTATPITRTLTLEECWSLLGDATIGRVAVVLDGKPHIVPVNYGLAHDDVVFRTAAGTVLDAAEGTPVAFEVDGIDASARSGWSVCVHGHSVAFSTTDSDQGVPVDSWAPRHRDRWYRVVPEDVTGRRLYGATRHQSSAREGLTPVLPVAAGCQSGW
jgi:nitroimidazol reductase NimA-like FMN-containing flavoprotein (pyridoxamine 5'-phosphate oxidase superfamily)